MKYLQFITIGLPAFIARARSSDECGQSNEVRTEAAGITAVVGDGNPGAQSDPTFRVDRPFIFVIDEVSTGVILYMGAINTI